MSVFFIDGTYYDNFRHIIKKNYNGDVSTSASTLVPPQSCFVIGAYFILTNICNLNCAYCFAKKDRKHDRLLLDTAKPLIYEIIKNSVLCRSFGKKEIIPYIKFSGGGEPTLNCDAMKQITDFAKSLLAANGLYGEFHLATNGQWNDMNFNSWINDNITNLLFSVDGIEIVNNIQRPRIDKSNGYRTLIQNLKQISNPNIRITFRMTVSNYSLPYLDESIDTFQKIGIQNVQIEPLMPFEIKDKIFEPDPDLFAKQYSYVKTKFPNINIFSSFDVFDRINKYMCGHQIGNIVSLFPDGTISSCPERASFSEGEFIRGRIENGKMVINEHISNQTGNCFERCKNCIVNQKCDLCISKVKLFHDKNYNTEYLCKIYKEIFIENIRRIISEKSINQYYSALYDINESRFIVARKGC